MRTFLAICITLGSWLGAGSAALAHSALLNCFDNADGTFTCQGDTRMAPRPPESGSSCGVPMA